MSTSKQRVVLVTGGMGGLGETISTKMADAGYRTVVNLGLHDDPRYSLRNERATVEGLGLRYVHIPVAFDAPTEADLRAFFDALRSHGDAPVWVHCAANLRVSAFLGLWRVIVLGQDRTSAFTQLHELWRPDAAWSAFIEAMLAKHGR